MPEDEDFLPAASISTLQQRAELLRRVRAFFSEHNYWEVETPLLSRDSCVDAWLDPFAVPLSNDETAWLQTSPEFSMKRLLVAGADRIFEITRSFRKDEAGTRHNPEFTLLEWYACGTDHEEQMQFVERLVLSLQEHSCSAPRVPVQSPIPRLTYQKAFQQFVGLCPHSASLSELAEACQQVRSAMPPGLEIDRDGMLNFLLAERVEPRLAELPAVFLHDYPPSQAALARVRPGPPDVAERFELYLAGVEICNGYHELTDAGELRERMHRQNALRREAGKPLLPVESRLLKAMERGLPASAGVALGLDRLVMWALGRASIQEVLAFPFDRT